jgi:hypothetical protein
VDSPSDEQSTRGPRKRVLHTSNSLGAIEAEVIGQELKTFHEERLLVATSEERADLVARLGMKILPSEDLKSRDISCRSNLVRMNHEREQTGFPKVTFGGPQCTIPRTFDLTFALTF